MQATDREELRREFLRLSPESHQARFHGLAPPLTDEVLEYLTRVDQQNHVAIGAVIDSPDLKSERGIGIARLIRLADHPETAEMAVTVADDMQQRGVGTILLDELMRAAKIRGISTVRAEVLAANAPMRRVLERVGGTVVATQSDAHVVAYDLAIEPIAGDPSLLDVLGGAARGLGVFLHRWRP